MLPVLQKRQDWEARWNGRNIGLSFHCNRIDTSSAYFCLVKKSRIMDAEFFMKQGKPWLVAILMTLAAGLYLGYLGYSLYCFGH